MNAILNVGSVVQAVLRPLRRRIWWLTAGGSIAVIVGCLLHTLPRWTEERRVDSLRRASFPIRSIDPADDDFGDLMPLIEIIGSRRFVFMGETTHEDRGTFDAETRLIRFLHQKMGFDVISIEWSYAGIDSLYEALKARGRNGEPFRQPLLPRYLEAHRPLLDYVCATHAKGDRPISLMGHHVYYFADTDLPQRMDSFLGSAKPEPLNHLQNERFQILLKRITSGSWPAPLSREEVTDFGADVAALIRHVEAHREQLARSTSRERVAYFEALLKSLPVWAASTRMHNPHDIRLDGAELNTRDETMARLIVRASGDLFPQRKMVILSANTHLLLGAGALNLTPGFTSMGKHLLREYGRDQVYSIVFEAYSDRNGPPLFTPLPNTLASLFHRIGDPYRFQDLTRLPSDHWLRRRPVGVRALCFSPQGDTAIWPEVCDGIFYMEEMRPARAKEQ